MVLPNAQERLSKMIQVLQQLQRLLTISATLSDVADLLACIEAEYGTEVQLEKVIQSLIGQHLATQVQQRQAIRQQFQPTQRRIAA